jgi:NhaC family Na+:H+ antiporter
MYADTFKEMDLAPEKLSRTLEDSGTVTSVLVPWNTGGAYHSGVLGVSTFAYFTFAFFNIISPFMTIFYAYAGIKIRSLAEAEGTSQEPDDFENP